MRRLHLPLRFGLLAVISAIVLVASGAPVARLAEAAETPVPPVIPSWLDPNCDTALTATDALAALRAIAGISTPVVPCTADVDGDGETTLRDARYLRLAVAGLVPTITDVSTPRFPASAGPQSLSVTGLSISPGTVASPGPAIAAFP